MAPLACAVANLVAVIAMALILAPGTPLVADLPVRELYIGEHLLAWRIGWATWMIAAATLLFAPSSYAGSWPRRDDVQVLWR